MSKYKNSDLCHTNSAIAALYTPVHRATKMPGIEIYGLHCPVTGQLRYVGKANDSRKRFQGHLREKRRKTFPLYCWIAKLAAAGKVPIMRVWCIVEAEMWPLTERSMIDKARRGGCPLLNIADGGDEPFCPKEVRAANGRLNAKNRDPKLWETKRYIGAAIREGFMSLETRDKYLALCDKYPTVFGQFREKLLAYERHKRGMFRNHGKTPRAPQPA